MTAIPPYVMTSESITVFSEGKPVTVLRGALNFNMLSEALLNERWDDVPRLLRAGDVVKEWSGGAIETDTSGRYTVNGLPLPDVLAQRAREMVRDGQSAEPLLKFWARLQKNPSKRSVDQLWGFLQHLGIPLTNDGTFLAYKGVRTDFKDVHTGTIDNSPGAAPSFPRNQISDDPNEACHEGLHVGSMRYATDFGPRVVICEVDPENVVCIPHDSSREKMRVCAYRVVGVHGGQEMPSTVIEDEDLPSPEWEESEASLSDVDDEERAEDESGVGSDDAPLEDTRKAAKLFKVPRAYKKYVLMDTSELFDLPLDELRRFAARGLRIVGASKIRGGKVALIECIREVLSGRR